jgi:hypothetical protein
MNLIDILYFQQGDIDLDDLFEGQPENYYESAGENIGDVLYRFVLAF